MSHPRLPIAPFVTSQHCRQTNHELCHHTDDVTTLQADAVYGEEDMPLPLPLGGAWELLDKERTIPSDNIVNLPPVLAPDQFFVDELDRIQSDIDGSGLC
jgi:hypothetical protein